MLSYLSSRPDPAAIWTYFPTAVVVLGYLMASRLPMPKVGMTKNKLVSVILLTLVSIGYVCGFAMRYPEICFWMPTVWSIMFLIWGQASATARAMYPPPLFPKKQPERPLERPRRTWWTSSSTKRPPARSRHRRPRRCRRRRSSWRARDRDRRAAGQPPEDVEDVLDDLPTGALPESTRGISSAGEHRLCKPRVGGSIPPSSTYLDDRAGG